LSKEKLNEKDLEQNIEEIPEYKPGLVKTLNVVAGILFIILILVIYLPAKIWKEEETVRNVGRYRMTILNHVEDLYKKMSGSYQTDPILAMKIVSALRDSTRADSNFNGKQVLKLEEGIFEFNVTKNFFMNFDTTFALKYEKRDTVIDTTYKIVMWNPGTFTHDTVFVNASRIENVSSDSLFRGQLETEISSRVSTNTYYRPYYLDKTFAYSPLIKQEYIIMVDTARIKISDPLKGEFKERRYLAFAFRDTSHGYIENGEPSWGN